jgi:hypothetical protein
LVPAQKQILPAALAPRDAYPAAPVAALGRAVPRAHYVERLGRVLARRRSRHRRIALFQRHLVNEFPAIFSFLFDPALDATNWRAEHALRPAVVTRKTCGGGNRTARGAASQQVLATVLRTADQRRLNATDVLVGLLTAPTPSVPRALRAALAVH